MRIIASSTVFAPSSMPGIKCECISTPMLAKFKTGLSLFLKKLNKGWSVYLVNVRGISFPDTQTRLRRSYVSNMCSFLKKKGISIWPCKKNNNFECLKKKGNKTVFNIETIIVLEIVSKLSSKITQYLDYPHTPTKYY